MMGGAARPPVLGPRARRGPALQSRDHARGGLSRQDRDDQACRLRSPAKPAPAPARSAGSKPATCKTCGGHGRVRAQQGFFAIERTCPTCHGRGQTIDNPCDKCAGAGRVTRERTLSVNVPAGVEDGTRIRLTGEGEAGMRGGPAGRSLYFPRRQAARVLPARRRGPLLPRADLDGAGRARRRIHRAHARRGEPRCSVPEGAQSGRQLRLRGKGMPVLRSRDFGRLFVQLVVETPQNLTRRQREAPDGVRRQNRRTRPIRKAPASSPR